MLVLITACGSETPPTSPETDRAALIALYHATDGPNWIRNANWLTNEPLHRWAGVVTDEDGRVVALELFQNNLDGFIPKEVGNLDHLVRLDITNRYPDKSSLGELFGTFTETLTVLAGAPPEYNKLIGCLPRRLKDQLDLKKSFLGGLPFCDVAGEARVTRIALEHAIENEDVEEVRRLLGDVSIVNEMSSELDTLVESAVRQGNPEILQALLDAGIEPACDIESGSTLLHRVIDAGNADIARVLVKVCVEDLNAVRTRRIRDQQTLLSRAIESGSADLVRVLIQAGADPNLRVSLDYDISNYLTYAIDREEVEIVKVLLDAGADANGADGGETPLRRAVDSRDATLVRLLVDAGADAGGDGPEMLFDAIRSGNADMVAAVLKAEADVEATDHVGRSVLEYAILSDNPGVVSTLIETGANINAKDRRGRSMLALARRSERDEIVRILVDAGAQE
ncbi:MAG: ankyrin repeat domain-containing protein [Chloroflexota bacterium]|nr:ankyrin repeat domain-containing protein [Chloroflexota bacterium]MDE2919242.1 ankyrin repeat domain-containing protein [Chloroflexota bacterium]